MGPFTEQSLLWVELMVQGREELAKAASTVMAKKRNRTTIIVYVTMVVVLALMLGVQTWQEQFSTDVYTHLAAFRELSSNPFNPGHPFVATNDQTVFFTPYAVGLGVIGWMFSAEPIQLLQIGSALNFTLFVVGLWMFTRSFTTHRWSPHLALFFSLVAWGINSWRWSGYWGLNSIGFGLGWPAMFASGMALIALVGLHRYFVTRHRWLILAIGVAAALIGVSHPLTGMWFLVAAVAIAATQPLSTLRAAAGGLLVGAIVAVALVLVWPYYSVPGMVIGVTGIEGAYAQMYRDVLPRSFLLIPGIIALVPRFRRSARDPLFWMFVGGAAVYIAGYLTGMYSLGRVAPLVALSAHVALADLLAGWLVGGYRRRIVAAWVGIVLIGLVGLAGSTSGLIRMVPTAVLPASLSADDRLTPMVEPYASLTDIVASSDVVFATDSMRGVVPAIGGRVVVPRYEVIFLTDTAARVRDRDVFFVDESSAAERDAVVARWGVTYVVAAPEDLASYPWLRISYRVLAETDAYVVFLVDRA